MFSVIRLIIILYLLTSVSEALADERFSQAISDDSLRTLKRIEYKEGIPSGILHAISVVETNTGQTEDFMPWPYTIRLNRYKSASMDNVDDAYSLLDKMIDVGYSKFDLIVEGNPFYSLSAVNVEDLLYKYQTSNDIKLFSRRSFKYMDNKTEAEEYLNSVVNSGWSDFNIGIMQIPYKKAKQRFEDVTQSFNTYDNISVMVDDLKEIRKQRDWWESVGMYHSKDSEKAKLYVKNVWSIYQRVYKLQVK